MPKARIYVSQPVIKRNRETGETENPILVDRGGPTAQARRVDILDSSGRVAASVVYDPEGTPSVYIEAESIKIHQ